MPCRTLCSVPCWTGPVITFSSDCAILCSTDRATSCGTDRAFLPFRVAWAVPQCHTVEPGPCLTLQHGHCYCAISCGTERATASYDDAWTVPPCLTVLH
ncbi:MAG: hypothetical protein EZS28_018431, partial [Streblomastix strix]